MPARFECYQEIQKIFKEKEIQEKKEKNFQDYLKGLENEIQSLKKKIEEIQATISNTKVPQKVEQKLNMAIESLKFIAKEGGKTLESEYGDISCNGNWCSNQAKHSLYALENV